MKKFKELMNEVRDMEKEVIPPGILMLRRMGIRVFPDGRKVAMYINKEFGMTFAVPFGGSGLPYPMSEPMHQNPKVNITGTQQ